MTAAGTSPAEPAELIAAEARRRRAFRLVMSAPLLWLLMLLAVRLVWGYVANHRLQTEIDRIRAAGEPILLKDVPLPDVPDEENAAILYQQAAAAMVRCDGANVVFDDFIYDYRVGRAYPEDGRTIVEANAETLRLLRQARDRPRVDWGVRLSSPVLLIPMPQFSDQRQLTRLAVAAAVWKHDQGEQAEAIEILRDVQALAWRVGDEQTSCFLSHLVSIAIDSIIKTVLEEILPTLNVAAASTPDHLSRQSVTPEQGRAVMQALLDDEPSRSDLYKGLCMERIWSMDTFDYCFLSGPGVGLPAGWVVPGPAPPYSLWVLLRPMYALDACRMLRNSAARIKAGEADNWDQAGRTLAALERPGGRNLLASTTTQLSDFLEPSLYRGFALHYRAWANRRMTAVALAIRLYELDYGRRPEKLEQLVPRYLDALPPDPFAVDGRTFGYLPNAKPPILYSVRDDGRDDGGTYVLTERGVIDNEQKDMPFFLDGDRPRPPLKLSFSGK